MGCENSKQKKTLIQAEKGYFAQKINAVKNSNVVIQDKVYMFGGARILEFDVKQMRINELPADAALRIPRQTQSEFIPKLNKIVTLGGRLDGQVTDVGYLFSPPDFHNYQKLPRYPIPIRNTSLTVIDEWIYGIGGETTGTDPDNIVKDVYRLSIKGGTLGQTWEKFSELAMPRKSANIAVTMGNIFIFGGYNGKGMRTTQIETIDLKTGELKVQKYRLPLGVEGARLCWHGDDILMVGGKRIGDKPDANVLLLDLEKKTIISMRDLNSPRDYPIIIPTALDEVVVIGGGGLKTCEKRSWNNELQDYEFKEIQIPGSEKIDDPKNYDTALPSFVNHHADDDVFPDLHHENKIIFGNEIDCFLIEFPSSFVPYFYPSPMRLQQKTGQRSIRSDPNTIYLVGGTDTSRTKISAKTYKFFIKSKEIVEIGKLNHKRYFTAFVHAGHDFYVIGGKSEGGQATATVEKLLHSDESKWIDVAPMKQPRFGHVAWVGGDKIYVIGGTSRDDGMPLEHCEVFDTKSQTWSIHPSFRMTPALNGASIHQIGDHIYIFGGQNNNDNPQTGIYRVDAKNPTSMEKLPTQMKVGRVDPFVFDVSGKIVVIGGSEQPLMEVFDGKTLQPEASVEQKSESFFHQLSNYTSDMKLENCSWG